MNKYEWYPFAVVGLAVLLASLVVGCGLLPSSRPPPEPAPGSTPPQLPTETGGQPESPFRDYEIADEQRWATVETFAGEGGQVTPSFHISGREWRITWAADTEYPEYAVLDVFVYPDGSCSLPVERISYSGDGSGGTAYVYEGGRDYYLKVIAAGLLGWTIRVEDYATEASVCPVQITRIHYRGADYIEDGKTSFEMVEADEYVEIKNRGDSWQVIAGWTLKNMTKGIPTFIFPIHLPSDAVPRPWALPPHHSIRVYTGEIYPESGGFCFHYCPGNIWDNEVPDVAALYNSRGEEVSRKSYTIPSDEGTSADE